MMQHKSIPFAAKMAEGEPGVIEGYASVYSVVDDGMDIVEPGAFAASIASDRTVKMLWQHDMGAPIGVWDEIVEDQTGLRVRGRILPDVQKGAEAIALFKAGAIDSLSIGYRVQEAAPDGGGRVRRILRADLFEVSCVTMPMNRHALATVKSADGVVTERDFENFLRDAGFSKREAATITGHGFKALLRDAGGANEPERDALISQLHALGEKFRG